ncbi:MAG: hypothetical protein M3410_09410 [Acidobacteriota bacterium]|nr:hypothetical protein [Acidobacteriota bacterium]
MPFSQFENYLDLSLKRERSEGQPVFLFFLKAFASCSCSPTYPGTYTPPARGVTKLIRPERSEGYCDCEKRRQDEGYAAHLCFSTGSGLFARYTLRSTSAKHPMIEAMGRAFADRAENMSDHVFVAKTENGARAL